MGKKNKIIFKSYYNKLKDAMAKRPISFNGLDSILYDGEMMLTIANVNITEANIMGIYLQFIIDNSKNLYRKRWFYYERYISKTRVNRRTK